MLIRLVSVRSQAVIASKQTILRKAFTRFSKDHSYTDFLTENGYWLESYALFMALKEHFDYAPWYEWEEDIRLFDTEAVK